jgi:hypothetical protein
MKEKRQHKRFTKSLYVKIISGHASSWGLVGDVSSRGIFVKSNLGFKAGTEIQLEVFMPNNKSSFLKGIIRRNIELPDPNRKNGLGIELVEKDAIFHSFIESLSHQH